MHVKKHAYYIDLADTKPMLNYKKRKPFQACRFLSKL